LKGQQTIGQLNPLVSRIVHIASADDIQARLQVEDLILSLMMNRKCLISVGDYQVAGLELMLAQFFQRSIHRLPTRRGLQGFFHQESA
jgi:hypothetical protein